MATIRELIAGIEVELEAAEKRESKARKEVEVILATVQQEGRSDLTEEEAQRSDVLFENVELAMAAQTGIKSKLARARKVEAQEAEAEARTKEVKETRAPKPHYDGVLRVGNEERTYNPQSDPRGSTFLRDICRQYLYNDVGAQSRLARHMQEERVERAEYMTRAAGDTTTTNWAGLTVPQYLVDLVAPATAALRPFADVCNKHPLPPDGLSVNISTVTTATAASMQTSQLVATTGVSIDDTLLTINVQTAEGWQTVSRQAIERGSGIEAVILQDLVSRYHTALDNQLLNQAAVGLSAASTKVTYDDATPTGAELYPKVMGAAAAVEEAMLAMGTPSHAIMHPRRWYWLAKEMTTSWPLINSQGIPVQAAGVNANTAYNGGIRGVLPNGLMVVVDANVTTTAGVGAEDEIYVVPGNECHLWEDTGAPIFIRAEQPNATALGVLLVVYGYFAYTFQRYTAGMQKVGGTGLTTPTF